MLYDRTGQSLVNFPQPLLMPPDLRCALSFWAPLKDATWAQGRGSGAPTYSGGTVSGAGAYKTYIHPTTGLITAGTSGAPRFEAGGYLAEGARTNLCVYSDDLTQAGEWTASNMTTAYTSTGADGIANHATRLTATAGNATILDAITSASAARVTSVWIKRITGTGNIDLTQDNGATWTTVTVTAGWTRVSIAAVTSADPTVGLRIVTSGDAVDVQGFQHEVGSFPSSLIVTAGAAGVRAADSVVYPSGANCRGGPGTAHGTMTLAVSTVLYNRLLDTWLIGNLDGVALATYSSTLRAYAATYSGGAAQSAITSVGNVFAVGVPTSLSASWDTNAVFGYANGMQVGSDTSAVNPVAPPRIAVGVDYNGTSQTNGTVRGIQIFGTALSAFDVARLR